MREKERIEVLQGLKELKKMLLKRSKCLEEFEKLKQDKTIQRYFSLQNQIKAIEEELNDRKIFNRNFNNMAAARFKDEWQYAMGCDHGIYIYVGSYDDMSNKVENEKSKNFDYNIYKCLDCSRAEYILKKDCENFEKEHFVLKNYLINSTLFYELQNEYYKHLIDHTLETSQKKLVKIFQEKYN